MGLDKVCFFVMFPDVLPHLVLDGGGEVPLKGQVMNDKRPHHRRKKAEEHHKKCPCYRQRRGREHNHRRQKKAPQVVAGGFQRQKTQPLKEQKKVGDRQKKGLGKKEEIDHRHHKSDERQDRLQDFGPMAEDGKLFDPKAE